MLEPTLLGAAGAQQMVSDLQRFGIPSERIELVTNARSEIGMVPRSDIEGGLGNRIVAEVPLSTHRNYARSVTTLARYISR